MIPLIIIIGIVIGIGIWLGTAKDDEIVEVSEELAEGMARAGETTRFF